MDEKGKQKELKDLQEQIDQGLKDFLKLSETEVERISLLVSEKVEKQIKIYSNEARNISLISGVVAPLSLTLLTIEEIDLDKGLLITGFVILIFNIMLLQILNSINIKSEDKNLAKAQFNWMMADSSIFIMKNSRKDSSEKTLDMFKYHKYIEKARNHLGLNKIDIQNIKILKNLRDFNNITNIIFIAGVGFIILSITVPLLLNVVI